MDGDVISSASFDASTGAFGLTIQDNVNTFTDESDLALGHSGDVVAALSIGNGKLRASSNAHSGLSVDDPGIVIYNPAHGAGEPPFMSFTISTGAVYVKTLAAWPFFMDTTELNSLIANFK
jgi:hypothetical protein